MKTIIFLVDMNNCRFLIINNNDDNWKLPSLNTKKKTITKTDISKLYQKKYKQDIKNITIIKETNEYIFAKCIAEGAYNYKKEHKLGVINAIMPIITNEFHNQLLLKLSIKIGIEILNDSFWLGIILSTEDRIDNTMMKGLLSDFLLFFSSSFCEETLTYKFGGIVDPDILSRKKLKEIRNTYFKLCPLYDSEHMKPIIDDMGIDFNNYIFDNVLIYANGELLDVNIRTWNNGNKYNHDNYNPIIMSARKWMQNFLHNFPDLVDTFEELRKDYVNKYIEAFNNISFIYKSYSTYKLFNKDLSKNDKIYILQRIGLLKTTMLFSKIFKNEKAIILDEKDGAKFDINIFLSKVKAVIIDMLWTDSKRDSIPCISKIINNYPNEIIDDFFPINRKCRDNIHYGFYNQLTNDELNILNKYQDLYLNYVIKEFEKNLIIKFGVGYKIGLTFAKIQHWTSNQKK